MSTQSNDSLKFYGVNLTNFKNLDKALVEIDGRSFIILGKNGAGKSSLIQAIMSPLDAKTRPLEPIRVGEERSQIDVILAGIVNNKPVKYILELYFTPGNKNGRLVVLDEDGQTVKSGATFIKSLIGNCSFDITKWLNESPEKKLKMLKQLTGCEIEIDKIQKSITDFKANKKFKKERVEELEGVLKNHGYSQEDIEKYSEPAKLEPLQEELANVSKSIATYEGIENKVNKFKESIIANEVLIVTIKDEVEVSKSESAVEVARLEELIKKEKEKLDKIISVQANKTTDCFENIRKAKDNIRKGEEWITNNTKASAAEINERISAATKHNEHHIIVSKHSDQQRELLKNKQEITKIDADIEALEASRNKLISKSQLPITGLSFTDDQILINGLPLDQTQQNTQHLFDISVEVAMALNPTLKCVFLHDASLFDNKNLNSIIKKCEEKGYQVIAEKVAENENLEIKFVETAL